MAGPNPQSLAVQPSVQSVASLPDGPLRLFFEKSADATFLVSGTQIVDCNQAALDLLGYRSKNDLISRHPSELGPQLQPDGYTSFDKVNEMLEAAIANGNHRFEWMLKRADDRVFPAECSLTAIELDGRQILCAVCRDITRRKGAESDRSKVERALLSQTEILTSILDHTTDAVIVADKDYRFLIFNPAAERIFATGATETKAEGWSRTYGLYLPDQVTPFPPDDLPLARSIRGEQVDDQEMFVRHHEAPNGLWISVSGRPLRDTEGNLAGGVIVCRDMTESKKEDAFRAGQSRVLEMIVTGTPLEKILSSLVQLIEQQADDMLCSILLLAEDGKHVRHGAAPSLPEVYVKAVDGAPIGPKNGSCGTAMYLGKQVIVTDVMEDPLWEDYRELAAISGLRACWSTPILSGEGKVLGSFAMYYREPQTPNGMEARLTEVATHIAGIAIEHQRDEEALRASEELFGKAFNANPNPMSLVTLEEGRILEVNESFIELSGYARPELIGRTSLEHIWEMPLTRDDLVRRVKEHGIVRDIEAKINTRSGASRVVLLSSLAVEIGGQHCLLSVSSDITERRKAEEQLRLLQLITMEIALTRDLTSALEVVTRRVCESTGWVLGQSWIPREDGTALECSAAWFGGAEGLEEFRLGSVNTRLPPGVGLPGRVWKSKKASWVRDVTVDANFPRAVLACESGLKAAFAFPVVASGEVIAVMEFFLREPQDEDERLVKVIATVGAQLNLALERKRAEEQLRRAQSDLAHVSRVTTMGQLAASIAHEVNQPLGAIVGNADICLNWLGDNQPDLNQLRDAIEDIASDGRRASDVIARIRGLVKKNVPQQTHVNINDVAQEVHSLVGHEVQRKGVRLDVNLSPSLPPVLADRVQLQQVLLNLLMNGMEAMMTTEPEQRQLTVTTKLTKEDQILVTVRDSGVGIKADQVEQVFKAFHSSKANGMGMGLAISRSIVEAHGGRLWAEPSRGPGATFKISLPSVGTES
jgi:PAS domain S-box-containing protein